jgi:hypothetical protein
LKRYFGIAQRQQPTDRSVPVKALERILPEQTFQGNIPVRNFPYKRRSEQHRLGLLIGLISLELGLTMSTSPKRAGHSADISFDKKAANLPR